MCDVAEDPWPHTGEDDDERAGLTLTLNVRFVPTLPEDDASSCNGDEDDGDYATSELVEDATPVEETAYTVVRLCGDARPECPVDRHIQLRSSITVDGLSENMRAFFGNVNDIHELVWLAAEFDPSIGPDSADSWLNDMINGGWEGWVDDVRDEEELCRPHY